MASEFVPVGGHTEQQVAEAAQLASLADETPEGRSIVVLAKQRFDIRERDLGADHTFIPFSATTRMSGLDVDRSPHPQRRRRVDQTLGRPSRAARCLPISTPSWRTSPGEAPPRWWWPTARRSSA